MLELVSAKWKGMKTWPGATMPVMRSSMLATAPRRLRTVTRSWGLRSSRCGVDWVHLEPRVGDHVVEQFDLGGLGAGVPVLDGAAGVEDEVDTRRRAVRRRDRRERCRGVARPSAVGKMPSR